MLPKSWLPKLTTRVPSKLECEVLLVKGCHSHGPDDMPLSLLGERCRHCAVVVLDCPDCVTSREGRCCLGTQVHDLVLPLIQLVLLYLIRDLADGIQGRSEGLVSFDTVITKERKAPFLGLSWLLVLWKWQYFGATHVKSTQPQLQEVYLHAEGRDSTVRVMNCMQKRSHS